MQEFVTVGILGRPHGVRGQIKCHPETYDLNRHKLLKEVFVRKSEKDEPKQLTITASSLAGKDWILKFEGFDAPETVACLTNSELLIPEEERLPLPEGMYYYSDFPGYKVLLENGEEVGEVEECMELPSVKAFQVNFHNGSNALVPWIDDCVLAIDTENETITCNADFINSLLANDAEGNRDEN